MPQSRRCGLLAFCERVCYYGRMTTTDHRASAFPLGLERASLVGALGCPPLAVQAGALETPPKWPLLSAFGRSWKACLRSSGISWPPLAEFHGQRKPSAGSHGSRPRFEHVERSLPRTGSGGNALARHLYRKVINSVHSELFLSLSAIKTVTFRNSLWRLPATGRYEMLRNVTVSAARQHRGA